MALDANSGVSPSVVSGTYTGTTAAQTIQLGFSPSWAIIYNITDGDKWVIWHKSSQTTVLTIDTESANESVAVTATDHGLSLPASDAVTNENGKTFVIIAGR